MVARGVVAQLRNPGATSVIATKSRRDVHKRDAQIILMPHHDAITPEVARRGVAQLRNAGDASLISPNSRSDVHKRDAQIILMPHHDAITPGVARREIAFKSHRDDPMVARGVVAQLRNPGTISIKETHK